MCRGAFNTASRFQGDLPLATLTFRLVCEDPPVGDLNGDCRADSLDLAMLSDNWLVDRGLQLQDLAQEELVMPG